MVTVCYVTAVFHRTALLDRSIDCTAESSEFFESCISTGPMTAIAMFGTRVSCRAGEGGEEEEVSIDHFCWVKPEEFAREEAKLLGWASIMNHSLYVRSHVSR